MKLTKNKDGKICVIETTTQTTEIEVDSKNIKNEIDQLNVQKQKLESIIEEKAKFLAEVEKLESHKNV